MISTTTSDFGGLLRKLRVEAGLSQEALAERAGISVDAVCAYERRARYKPRRETISLLVAALQLTGPARVDFESSASRKRGAPSSSTDDARHNLPWQPTSFIGRRHEIEAISRLLTKRCLTTIIGTGGIGKTRIALEIASRLDQFPRDGIWFVDLSAIDDGALVLSKVASVLDLPLPEQSGLLAALAAACKHRELLLIFDNCEHVLDAVRSVAGALLQSCPEVTLLATSRERIGSAGERVYRLSTLSVPKGHAISSIEGRTYDALELFADRAAMAVSGFVLRDEDVEVATDICHRLNGVALAIELAVARLPVLGLAELRSQLKRHFLVIGGGHQDLPARHRTLSATITWSHDLLDESERMLFRRLAVFSGGWTLDAAEAVCAGTPLEPSSVLDTLLSLVEKSLVVVDLDASTPRYSFFESTRAFALERLTAGERSELSNRHGEWMALFSDHAYDMYAVASRRRWERAVAPELDNALSALEWALAPGGDAVLAGRIASSLQGFWQTTGLAVCGRGYVHAALGRIDEQSHPALVARLLVAQFRFLHGEAALNAITRAISLLERVSDPRTLARCYGMLSHVFAHTGKYSDAEIASDKASVILHEEGLQRSSLYSSHLCARSTLFRIQGRLAEAKTALEDAVLLAKAVDDDWFISRCQTFMAEIELAVGNAPRAIETGKDALASARRVRSIEQEVYSLSNLACYHLVLGEIDAAEANAREVLGLANTSSANAPAVYAAIQHLAAVAALRNSASRAARLLGYVNAWFDRVGCRRDPTDKKSYDILMESLRKQLPDDEISKLATQGAQITEGAAVNEALRTYELS